MDLSSRQEEIISLFSSHPEVKLAYLFGSQADGTAGAGSDYDFALYIDGEKNWDILFECQAKLSRILGMDRIDVVNLYNLDSPELAYNIINGKLLYEQEPYKLFVEPKILNDFFDFKMMLQRNGLTREP